jgi:hypothetical protein
LIIRRHAVPHPSPSSPSHRARTGIVDMPLTTDALRSHAAPSNSRGLLDDNRRGWSGDPVIILMIAWTRQIQQARFALPGSNVDWAAPISRPLTSHARRQSTGSPTPFAITKNGKFSQVRKYPDNLWFCRSPLSTHEFSARTCQQLVFRPFSRLR